MKTKWVWLLAGVLTGAMSAGWGTEETSDEALQGSWQAISMEKDAVAAPQEAIDRMHFRFEGDKLFIRGNAFDPERAEEGECLFRTDKTEEPKHLDFTPTKLGKAVLAIYEKKGRILTVCLRHTDSDKGRPKEFRTTPDSDLVLILFQLE